MARWADRRLDQLARESGSTGIAALSGAGLMAERAVLHGFAVPGLVSAGGGCRFFRAGDGWIALNLARSDDRDCLPALFQDETFDHLVDGALEASISQWGSATLLSRARSMGMAIAAVDERPSPALGIMAQGSQRTAPGGTPVVVDLSALWAGPLAGRLLRLAGADVIKVENPRRPDGLRSGDPALFARLNEGKREVALDITTASGRSALLSLIASADIVIESSRPRALAQLGISSDALVASCPGLVWLTITGHGARAPQDGWVAFGDDAAVAGGLTAAIIEAGGAPGFGGDAPADPLTGIAAALAGWRAWQAGRAQRIGLAMSGVIAAALAEERAADAAALDQVLLAWSLARGAPFPSPPVD